MNPQETQQVVARDEKQVPSIERVKISSTNIRLETTVPQKEETFQVQFWYIFKKVQDTNSYEFLLANKKCTVNAEVFRTILDICPRVEGVDFTDVLDDDIALTFLIDLGYKGPLNRHTKCWGSYMHQPWITLASIINKCLFEKTASNDKPRKSRINILWGMSTVKQDCKDYQEYRLSIPNVMLTDAIKHSESYHMFSTNQIPPKKSRGKGSKGKKTADESQETIDVSEESEPEPEPAKKKTSTKSISQTEAEEAEAARKVHATHARIVTESVPESAKKKSGGRKQEASDIMQALKESKKTSKRQPGTGGSNEGSSKPGVPDESKVVSATSSEGTGVTISQF
ncbi:hypothetical protein Tco_1494084 [Tanacetum coccineum]